MNRTLARAPFLACFVLLAVAACTGNDIIGGGGGGGVPGCSTCYEVYVNGGVPCGPGPSTDAYQNLYNCACQTPGCFDACAATFCVSMSADMTCGTCLAKSCNTVEMACAAN
jgi:hypothetical protein